MKKTRLRAFDLVKLLLGFVCLISFAWLLRALFLGYFPDFSGYFYGSKYLFQGLDPYLGGGSLYTSYVYPPIVLLIFAPFTLLSFKTAEIIWILLNLVFLLISLKLMSDVLEVKFFSKLNLLLMFLVFISFPTKFSFGMGQINILILLLMVYGLWLVKKKKEFLSGIVFGISFVVKLFPFLLPVYFLLKLQKKVLIGIFVSVAVSIFLVIIFIPSQIYFKFLFQILPTFATSWKLDYYNQALGGVVGRSFGTGQLANQLKIVCSIIILLITFSAIFLNKQKDFLTTTLKFGILIIANLLINTFSWQHHFVWLIIPFYATVIYLIRKNGTFSDFILVAISYIFISINFANPKILPTFLQSHVFIGAFLLMLLQVKLLLDRKK